MTIEIRKEAAKFYDAHPRALEDVPFYEKLVAPTDAVLELGCGTGRVLLPLARKCRYIHGLDISEAMVSICKAKLRNADIPLSRARSEVADITNFDLGRKFNLIIAPFRVFQNLETDPEVDGLFSCVRKHLTAGGSCILNVFMPNRDPEGLRRYWCTDDENFLWEVPFEDGRLTCHDRRRRIDRERLVLYPEIIYRFYKRDAMEKEVVLRILMRCYYPEEFERLVADHGFEIMGRWGGYAGEAYGEGPELVLQFRVST
jgi:SAM-dependent methyltransferase